MIVHYECYLISLNYILMDDWDTEFYVMGILSQKKIFFKEYILGRYQKRSDKGERGRGRKSYQKIKLVSGTQRTLNKFS